MVATEGLRESTFGGTEMVIKVIEERERGKDKLYLGVNA